MDLGRAMTGGGASIRARILLDRLTKPVSRYTMLAFLLPGSVAESAV